ncbi:MAG: hypothetical protein ACD_18C00304G0002 [uncultured bacterium]|nr:MAG: hypothetical protein ACD_18C00304G0002 [uncultured bacterium]OGH88915.1 MAG: hypothetical protein A2507_00270 [Candidatus Magasanikbacteria bacterium RIFOXYD12_FULL_33_17]
MKKELLQVRVDPKVKKQVNKIFSSLGIDVSTGVRIYLSQVILHKGIPFSVVTENGFTSSQENQILKEFKKTKKLYDEGNLIAYSSIKDLKDSLEE